METLYENQLTFYGFYTEQYVTKLRSVYAKTMRVRTKRGLGLRHATGNKNTDDGSSKIFGLFVP